MIEAPEFEDTVVERVDTWLGATLGGYRLEQRLAVGGFGAVYRATHLASGGVVAIKILHDQLARDPGLVARFLREGAALCALRDPHTVTAYELGDENGTLFIAMELLRGESLQARFVRTGPMPWPCVLRIATAACRSLVEAHALGIVHRDLKPSNIHLEPPSDFVKIIDFGVAKVLHGSALDSIDLTQQGQMIGTFDYMSPEQLAGSPCTPASDLYTLGVVMYEMIAGVRPFPDEHGPAGMLAALLTQEPRPLAEVARVPAEVARVVMRCLEREPTARLPDAYTLAAELERLLAQGDPPSLAPRARTPSPQLRFEHTLIGPVPPLPPPPPSGFEARGSDPVITPEDNPLVELPYATLPAAPAPRRARWIALGVALAAVSAALAALVYYAA